MCDTALSSQKTGCQLPAKKVMLTEKVLDEDGRISRLSHPPLHPVTLTEPSDAPGGDPGRSPGSDSTVRNAGRRDRHRHGTTHVITES